MYFHSHKFNLGLVLHSSVPTGMLLGCGWSISIGWLLKMLAELDYYAYD
jgi:hypothetical protein